MSEQDQESKISPIEQFRELLRINKERKINLHETLDLLNEISNYNNHLTIGGCFISPDSVRKIIWATIEIDVISGLEIKENKNDRMCPIATHVEQLKSIKDFHRPIFKDKKLQEDTWEKFIKDRKILPVSTVIDRCLNTQNKENIELVLDAEYFIVIFPNCTNSEKSSLFNWLLYKQGRVVFFDPVIDKDSKSYHYIVRHSKAFGEEDFPKVEDFWNNYDENFKDYLFINFVNWIIKEYNDQIEVKKPVVFYVGYCFSDYEDARLWTAFTDDIKEDDLYAAESLLYRLHQKQIDSLMRETLIKHPIADLWSEERKDWFIYSNENLDEIIITHNLTINSEERKEVRSEIEKLLNEYIQNIPAHWLEEQLSQLYDTLKVLCGKCSITQGDTGNIQKYQQKAVTLNSLFLISALSIGQKVNSQTLFEEVFSKIKFLNVDISLTEAQAFSSDNGRMLIKSFFDLIQQLCLNDENTSEWQLNNIELQANHIKFAFGFNMKKVKSGRSQSLLNAILNRGRIGELTETYHDFEEHISKVVIGDTTFRKSLCVVRLYPSYDFKTVYLEINPIQSLTNLLNSKN